MGRGMSPSDHPARPTDHRCATPLGGRSTPLERATSLATRHHAAVSDDPLNRLRREPPRFRRATVTAVDAMTPFLTRVRLEGEELRGLDPGLPAASVRLLLPERPDAPLVLPSWEGNDFRMPDGSRAPIRTLTPVDPDPASGTLTIDVVRHDAGLLTAWVDAVGAGGEVAVSGPGRGYEVDERATSYVIAGDETALPAMGQVVAAIPAGVAVRVLAEVRSPDARLDLPTRPDLDVTWLVADESAPPGAALAEAMSTEPIDDGTAVWAAGEAAAVQRIRRHLFDERGLTRSRAHVRGYWKHGRTEG